MNRLEELRIKIDEILEKQPDLMEKRCGYVHLYGVGTLSGLLAIKRNLNVEMATTIGMLHDIYNYKYQPCQDHAILGSVEAQVILNEMTFYNEEEIRIIVEAIKNHSNKSVINNVYDELLKDADVLQHFLYNTDFEVKEHEKKRLNQVMSELGLNKPLQLKNKVVR